MPGATRDMPTSMQTCPLCGLLALPCEPGRPRPRLSRLPDRVFHHCRECDLIFVPASGHLPPDAQRARYLMHNNRADDAGYLATLTPVMTTLSQVAPAARRVLDYGSGPNPVLVTLLRRAGFDAIGYDPLFAPDAGLSAPFDAIVSTETVEHFENPRAEFERFAALLRPGGALILTTHLHPGPAELADWWYARDPTHVAFYSARTFDWIAQWLGWRRSPSPATNVVVLENPERS